MVKGSCLCAYVRRYEQARVRMCASHPAPHMREHIGTACTCTKSHLQACSSIMIMQNSLYSRQHAVLCAFDCYLILCGLCLFLSVAVPGKDAWGLDFSARQHGHGTEAHGEQHGCFTAQRRRRSCCVRYLRRIHAGLLDVRLWACRVFHVYYRHAEGKRCGCFICDVVLLFNGGLHRTVGCSSKQVET